jgi:hypothetical protein
MVPVCVPLVSIAWCVPLSLPPLEELAPPPPPPDEEDEAEDEAEDFRPALSTQ